jgi:tRNA-2-methylthio-N6-dimethylallyladenosine synthase
MEGCEKHCAFCVVPTTRGRQRSHPPAAVLAEVRGLAAEGCREVTLLGQTVEMYGRDLAPAVDLASLLEQVNDVEGIERIRFTTSNPFNFTTRLIQAIRDVPKVCEWVHLPLQSGSDRVLERMNRGYTGARYLELVAELRGAVPAVALSTDLIVGFPGETEADFEATLAMIERVRYDNVFAFRYSPRPGTPAAAMPDQVPLAVKADRNGRLLEVAGRVAAERSGRLAGCTLSVLVDGRARKDAAELSGRTRCNRVVNFAAGAGVRVGDVVGVRVTAVLPHSLRGTLEPLGEEVSCLSR